MMQEQSNPESPSSPLEMLAQKIWGANQTQMIYVAAQLDLADHLAQEALTSEQLAALTQTHEATLYRLLRALASIGILEEDEENRFALTNMGAYLRSDFPGAMKAFALQAGATWYWRPWGELLGSVQSGQCAFPKIFEKTYFEYFGEDTKAAAIFNATMRERTKLIASAVCSTYDFSDVACLADIGGGHGALLAAILKKNPQMKGMLFDLEPVIEGAPAFLEAKGVLAQCSLQAGDFFRAVPQGADTYLMANVLHDWNDDQALAILNNCHQAIPHHGRLVLVEYLIPPGNDPFFGKIMDLDMLVLLGGKERTELEFEGLLDQAEFMVTDVLATPSPFSIIEAIPK